MATRGTLKNLNLLNSINKHYKLGDEYFGNEYGEVYKLKEDGSYHKMSPYDNRDGYTEYVLTNSDGVKKHIMGQIVSAGLFVKGYSETKCEVNHKDGDRSNNYYKNLEWKSHQDNVQHSYDKLRD